MTLELYIYLAEVAGNLQAFACVVTLIVGIALLIAVPMSLSVGEGVKPWVKHGIYVMIVSALLSVLTPSTQTMYMIAGTTAAKEAAQSEIATKVQALITKKLDEYLK